MHKFPNNTSEATPIEHLSQDYLDRTKENDEDGFSFEDNFVAEILDSLCEARDVKQSPICALTSHLNNKRIFSSSILSLMFLSTTSSRRLLTRKHISKLTHLSHLTNLVLVQFLILTRQLSRKNSSGSFKMVSLKNVVVPHGPQAHFQSHHLCSSTWTLRHLTKASIIGQLWEFYSALGTTLIQSVLMQMTHVLIIV